MFFCKDKRPDVVKAHPDWKMGEIAKELGAQWGKLSDKDKEKYNKVSLPQHAAGGVPTYCHFVLGACFVLVIAPCCP
jgi:hypothetical protein